MGLPHGPWGSWLLQVPPSPFPDGPPPQWPLGFAGEKVRRGLGRVPSPAGGSLPIQVPMRAQVLARALGLAQPTAISPTPSVAAPQTHSQARGSCGGGQVARSVTMGGGGAQETGPLETKSLFYFELITLIGG